jgi:transcriptional regulator with XRE-family HTH domain
MDYPILPKSEHQRAVGVRLRRTIDALGLSYTRAAEVMGTSRQVLHGWMEGRSYPENYCLYRLCRAYRVTFDYAYLGDWAMMPAALAQALETALAPPAAAAPEPDRQDAESNAPGA